LTGLGTCLADDALPLFLDRRSGLAQPKGALVCRDEVGDGTDLSAASSTMTPRYITARRVADVAHQERFVSDETGTSG